MRNTELLTEAFRRIVIHRIPVCDDLILELDDVKVRVTRVLRELEDDKGLLPLTLADQLGLPSVGATFEAGVRVYRAFAPQIHLPQTGGAVGSYRRAKEATVPGRVRLNRA